MFLLTRLPLTLTNGYKVEYIVFHLKHGSGLSVNHSQGWSFPGPVCRQSPSKYHKIFPVTTKLSYLKAIVNTLLSLWLRASSIHCSHYRSDKYMQQLHHFAYPVLDDFHSTFWMDLHGSGLPSLVLRAGKYTHTLVQQTHPYTCMWVWKHTVWIRMTDRFHGYPRIPSGKRSVGMTTHELLPIRVPGDGTEWFCGLVAHLRRSHPQVPQD